MTFKNNIFQSSPLFNQGRKLYNEGNIYEAHIIWEKIWKHGDKESRKQIKGFIQLSGAIINNTESDGNLVMNEHNANRIAVFNPSTETLVEYTVPSRNPNWADCEGIDYCGLAQVFGFAIHGKKIWFTEWVENNIGVVDTSILLPFTVDINTENVLLEKGQTIEVLLQAKSTIISDYWHDETLLNISTTSPFTDLVITSEYTEIGSFNDVTESIPIQITASDSALPGTYKVLLGVLNNEIAVSEFITVTIV